MTPTHYQPPARSLAPRPQDRSTSAVGAVAIVALLTLLLQLASPVPLGHASSGFSDVPDDHPFVTEISWLVEAQLTTGFPDGRFRPTAEVSRQAAAAFLYRLAGEPAVSSAAGFDDVPANHPFHDAIAWLVDEGITSGFQDNTFRPTRAVSRQAAAAFLHRFEGEPSAVHGGEFSDVPSNHPFAVQVSWMVQMEVASGFPDGTFRPADPVTRQAMAAFIYRLAAPPEPAVLGVDKQRVAQGGNEGSLSSRCSGFTGGSVRINGRLFERARHCSTWAFDDRTHTGWEEYDLGRAYSVFTTTVGQTDDSSRTDSEIRFTVYGDGRVLSEERLRFGQSVDLDVDVTGVLRLRLEMANTSMFEDGWRSQTKHAFGEPTVR